MSDQKKNGGAAQGADTTTETNKTTATQQNAEAPLLGKVSRKSEFLCKRGPCFAYQGKTIDLRKITDDTAVRLANDPRCMFLVWKEKEKRPQGQRIHNEDVYVKI